jgi:hypothetical protein
VLEYAGWSEEQEPKGLGHSRGLESLRGERKSVIESLANYQDVQLQSVSGKLVVKTVSHGVALTVQ